VIIADRIKGAMYGLAVGDAMGAPVEFRHRGKFEPVTGFRDGGPFKLKAGQWTDDTSMALCLAAS
jgi:ADP-ribosyl-[dinitrogen reductase] hydrolase